MINPAKPINIELGKFQSIYWRKMYEVQKMWGRS